MAGEWCRLSKNRFAAGRLNIIGLDCQRTASTELQQAATNRHKSVTVPDLRRHMIMFKEGFANGKKD
jgi:hypothetical protein